MKKPFSNETNETRIRNLLNNNFIDYISKTNNNFKDVKINFASTSNNINKNNKVNNSNPNNKIEKEKEKEKEKEEGKEKEKEKEKKIIPIILQNKKLIKYCKLFIPIQLAIY